MFRVARKRGPQWYAKYRLPDGRQVQKRLGPEWTEKGRPPAGYYTRKTAQAALQALSTDARRGTLNGVRTDATFADASAEWLRHAEIERGVKHSTLLDYKATVRTHLDPAFGAMPLERITTAQIERFQSDLRATGRSRRTVNKVITQLHGIFERARKVHGLSANPVADAERQSDGYSGEYDFFSPEEVLALSRAAASDTDAAIFLTLAFTGLRRGEVLALRWREVDFEGEALRVHRNSTYGQLGTPKSGKVRSVPMVEPVAQALARLGQRERFTAPDDLVFPNEVGAFLDGSALRRRFIKARNEAGLRPIRLHDLRHTFGSLAINRASITQVQHWMGHSRSSTTERYLHHKSRAGEARLLAEAFAVDNGVERGHDAASTRGAIQRDRTLNA